MKALKTGLVIAATVLFYIACSSPQTTNQNANSPVGTQPANTNATVAVPPAPDPYSQAQANTNAAPQKPADTKTPPKADPVPGVDGASLFVAQKCATCHGTDGKGKLKGVPDFSNAEWQKKESNDELIHQILEGEPPKMPAYKGKLSDVEIKALVGHIRSFAK